MCTDPKCSFCNGGEPPPNPNCVCNENKANIFALVSHRLDIDNQILNHNFFCHDSVSQLMRQIQKVWHHQQVLSHNDGKVVEEIASHLCQGIVIFVHGSIVESIMSVLPTQPNGDFLYPVIIVNDTEEISMYHRPDSTPTDLEEENPELLLDILTLCDQMDRYEVMPGTQILSLVG